MARLHLYITGLFLFSLCSTASAQLSQLDFDTALKQPKKKQVTAPSPLELLRQLDADTGLAPEPESKNPPQEKRGKFSTPAEKPQESKEPVETPTGKNETVQKKPSLADHLPRGGTKLTIAEQDGDASEYSLIPPARTGPKTDDGTAISITSSSTWSSPDESKCWELDSAEQLNRKSNALKEIIFRFTGSHDYYDGLNSAFCAPLCQGPDQAPTLTGLTIADTKTGGFIIDHLDGACRYQLSRPDNGKWGLITADKLLCHCLRTGTT